MRGLELCFKIENVSCSSCSNTIMQLLEEHQPKIDSFIINTKKSFFNLETKVLTLAIDT